MFENMRNSSRVIRESSKRYHECIFIAFAHGMLTASFFSAVLGTKFPGKGSIYISQSLEFKRPVYLGDVVAVSVVVKSVDIKRKRVVLDTLCYVLGKVTTTGSAELFIP